MKITSKQLRSLIKEVMSNDVPSVSVDETVAELQLQVKELERRLESVEDDVRYALNNIR